MIMGPYIHLNDTESEGKAKCGCILEYDEQGNAMFYQCDMHESAPDLLGICRIFINRITQKGNIDHISDEGLIEDAEQAIAKADG